MCFKWRSIRIDIPNCYINAQHVRKHRKCVLSLVRDCRVCELQPAGISDIYQRESRIHPGANQLGSRSSAIWSVIWHMLHLICFERHCATPPRVRFVILPGSRNLDQTMFTVIVEPRTICPSRILNSWHVILVRARALIRILSFLVY
jgi:hypothetical protein